MSSVDVSLAYLLAAAIGYLLGSVPFGLILTKLSGHGDIRDVGSGNIGATNVLRAGGKKLAALTFLLDAAKGTLAVWLAARFGPEAAMIAGLAAFLGHLFPVWLGFKGGKGVSTYIGVVLGLYWPAALVFCAVWLGMFFLQRTSSLSALTASVATPLFLAFQEAWPLAALTAGMTLLLFVRHAANIQRLLRGEEERIGASEL